MTTRKRALACVRCAGRVHIVKYSMLLLKGTLLVDFFADDLFNVLKLAFYEFAIHHVCSLRFSVVQVGPQFVFFVAEFADFRDDDVLEDENFGRGAGLGRKLKRSRRLTIDHIVRA